MTYGLYILAGSAGALIVLTALLRAEQASGERLFLSSVRSFLDRLVTGVSSRVHGFFGHMGAGVIRTTAHYILHHVLGGVIAVLTRLQRKLFHAYERNKWQKNSREQQGEGNPHLNAIADHKRDTALTESEKKKMRSH